MTEVAEKIRDLRVYYYISLSLSHSWQKSEKIDNVSYYLKYLALKAGQFRQARKPGGTLTQTVKHSHDAAIIFIIFICNFSSDQILLSETFRKKNAT